MKPYYEREGVVLYHGDVIDCLRAMPEESVHCVVTSPPYWGLDKPAVRWYNELIMRDTNGRFIKGVHYSEATEFKPGKHWRPHQRFRDKDYLLAEYIENKQSAQEIAVKWGVTANCILFWLKKHGIAGRTTSEARTIKHWGSSREANPMFGKTGDKSSNWKGGVTPERQRIYSSLAWSDAVKAVWARDNGQCTDCGKQENGHKMHIHHIQGFDDAPELRCDPANLRLVCSKCHGQYHRGGR